LQPALTFAQHVHDLHAEIRHKITVINNSYKLSAYLRRRDISFEAGDFVMARIQHEQLPKLSNKKAPR